MEQNQTQSQNKVEKGEWTILGRKFNDLELFITRYFHQYLTNSTPPFMREIYHLLFDHIQNNNVNQRIALAGARELGKTIAVAVFYPTYCIAKQKKGNIIIISKTAEQSEQSLSIITNEFLMNPLLAHEFPFLYPLRRISRDAIEFATGQLISAKGKDYQIRGHLSTHGRPDLIIVDDPEETIDVNSETARRTLKDWFDRSVVPAVAPQGQLVLIGNIINHLCFMYQVVSSDTEYLTWIRRTYPILVNGESIWKDRWTTERIEKVRSDNFRVFQSEYMCQPVQPEMALIQQEWINIYNRLPEETTFDTFVAVDPAGYRQPGANKNRDNWGFCIVSKARNGEKKDHVYIIHWERFRKPSESVLDKIVDTCRLIRPTDSRIRVEKAGLSDDLIRNFNQAVERHGGYLKIVPVTRGQHTGDLRYRMELLTGMFETGKVHFRPQDQKLIYEELLPFPFSEHDDAVSALEMCLTICRNHKFIPLNQGMTNPLIQRYGAVPEETTGLLR